MLGNLINDVNPHTVLLGLTYQQINRIKIRIEKQLQNKIGLAVDSVGVEKNVYPRN